MAGHGFADDWKDQIKVIMALPGNDKCAECLRPRPDWGVPNIGVLVCIHCSGLHREMGTHIAKVKSCILDSWTQPQLDELRSKGNTLMNRVYQRLLPKWAMPVSECCFKEYRKWFICEKYARRRWFKDADAMDEKKDDAFEHGSAKEYAPGRLQLAVFKPETGKKKVILQLLGEYLHYFRSSHDSFSFERYNVKNLNVAIDGDDTERRALPVLVIGTAKGELFRLVSKSKDKDIFELVRFAEEIRKAHMFYNSTLARASRASAARYAAETAFTKEQIELGVVLGIASKKGGGVHGYKKRWWVLYSGHLYYFKKDFRKAKKSTLGKPQGCIGLFGADISWEPNRSRSGKKDALLIATPERTFYIVPASDCREAFFSAVESECLKLWPRVEVDFTTL